MRSSIRAMRLIAGVAVGAVQAERGPGTADTSRNAGADAHLSNSAHSKLGADAKSRGASADAGV